MFFTLSSHSRQAPGSVTPAIFMAVRKLAALCFVSSLHLLAGSRGAG
jgi:hypothetical protein